MKNTAVALAIGLIVVGLFLAVGRALQPMQYRQAIFEPEHMQQGFRSMSELFPSRTISRGGVVSAMPVVQRDLSPVRFSSQGKEYSFADLLEPNRTQGLIVLHRGNIVYENYFDDAHSGTRFTSWSVAKSFNATLVGLAIEEGLIDSVNDPLDQYVPQLKGTAYDGVSIRQALQMSSGVAFSEEYDGSWVADVTRFMALSLFANLQSANEIAASFPRGYEPGTQFNYNSAESQIIGWLVASVTGKHPADYLSEKIWRQLGMSHDATWNLDQYGESGAEMGGCCINAALRDYARFGQLYLQDGQWQGRQLLPPGWVEEATTPDADYVRFGASPDAETGYQYQWWRLGEDAFAAEGVHGQFIYVNPPAQVVIVKASAWEQAWPDDMAKPAIAGMHAIAAFVQQQDGNTGGSPPVNVTTAAALPGGG